MTGSCRSSDASYVRNRRRNLNGCNSFVAIVVHRIDKRADAVDTHVLDSFLKIARRLEQVLYWVRRWTKFFEFPIRCWSALLFECSDVDIRSRFWSQLRSGWRCIVFTQIFPAYLIWLNGGYLLGIVCRIELTLYFTSLIVHMGSWQYNYCSRCVFFCRIIMTPASSSHPCVSWK